MFWIPLCIIAVSCIAVYSAYREIRRSAVDRELRKNAQRRSDFSSAVTDNAMERPLQEKYNNDPLLAHETVCKFVGQDIPMNLQSMMMAKWVEWAVATEMCKHGRLPAFMIFSNLNCDTSSKQERKFIEDYLLKLQQELRLYGIHNTVMYGAVLEYNELGYPKYQYTPLNQYIERCGHGSTKAEAEIHFAETL